MGWFHNITHNPHIDVALLVDGEGRLVATTNRIGSEAGRVASMIKAAEVLAQGLSAELGSGQLRSLQLSTTMGHLLVMPVGVSHYLIVLTTKDAPLGLVFIDMQRLLDEIDDDIRRVLFAEREPSPLADLDVGELIEAVSEWLRNGAGDIEPDDGDPMDDARRDNDLSPPEP